VQSVEEIVFEVGGGLYPLPERQSTTLAEKLRLCAKGKFPDDVRLLAARCSELFRRRRHRSSRKRSGGDDRLPGGSTERVSLAEIEQENWSYSPQFLPMLLPKGARGGREEASEVACRDREEDASQAQAAEEDLSR